MADNVDVKWIQVYKNGDLYSPPVKFVVYRKYCRNFESLLNSLTYRLKPSFGAVRNLYTPDTGTKIESLEEIHANEKYVAAGTEKFRSISYESIGVNPVRHRPRNFFMEASKRRLAKAFSPGYILQKIRNSIDNALIQPVVHSRIKAPSRYKKEVANSDALTIFVYRNGNDIAAAHVVALSKKDMRTWEVMLQRISERVLPSPYGFVRKLYTLQGHQLHIFSELQNGYSYVAVVGHESFRRIPYGMLSPPQSRKFSPWKHTQSVTRFQPMVKNITSYIQRTPNAKVLNSEPSGRLQRTLLNEREKQKGIFTVKDQHSQSPTSIKQVDYDQDNSGVYRARSQDPLIADEIRDSRETVVELPLDDRPAEEIRAEEIQTQPIRRRYDLQANVEDGCSGIMPSSEPSVEVELDDSGNIISLTSVTSNPCLPVCVSGDLDDTTGSQTWRSSPTQKGGTLESLTPIGLNPKKKQLNTEKQYSSWSNDIRDLKKRLLSNLSSPEESRAYGPSEGTKLHASPDFFLSQTGGPLAVEEFYRHSQNSRHQTVPKYISKTPRHDTGESLTVQPLCPVKSASATRNDGWKAESARVDAMRPHELPNVVESVSTFETARDNFLLDTARGGHTHDELPLVFITARERASCQKLLLFPDEQSCGDKLMREDSIALSSSSVCISPNSIGSEATDLRGDYVRHPSPVTSEEMKLYIDRFEGLTVCEDDSPAQIMPRHKNSVEIVIPKLGKASNLRNDIYPCSLNTPRPSMKSNSCMLQRKESRSNDSSPNSLSTQRASVKNYSSKTHSETDLCSNASTPSTLNTPRTSVKNQSFRTQPDMEMLLSRAHVNTDFSNSDRSDSWTYSPMALCKPYQVTLSPVKPERIPDSEHMIRLLNSERESSPSFTQSTRSMSTDASRSLRNNCNNVSSSMRGNEIPCSNEASPTKCSRGTLKVKVDLKSRRYSVFKVPAPHVPIEADGLVEVNVQDVNCNPQDSVNRTHNIEKLVSS